MTTCPFSNNKDMERYKQELKDHEESLKKIAYYEQQLKMRPDDRLFIYGFYIPPHIIAIVVGPIIIGVVMLIAYYALLFVGWMNEMCYDY